MTFNLPLHRNFGREVRDLSPDLHNQLSEMYAEIASAFSDGIKKDILTGQDPQAVSQRNTLFSIGDITIRTDTDTAWIMTSRTDPETVVWTQIT